jgi:hypothetical protein
MNELLFEQLDNSNLLKGREPNLSVLEKLSRTEILDLLQQSNELTSAVELSRENSLFSQSASLSLSGGRTPCVNLECRLRRVRNLAQYAALYADKVYAYNNLAYHLARHDEPDEEELKADVFDDLIILGYLRPLIEAGRIVLITPPEEFCPRCFGYKFAEKQFRKKTKSLYKWLNDKFLNDTQVELQRCGPAYGFLVSGSEVLLEHGSAALVFKDLPEELSKKTRIMAKIDRGDTVKLSRSILERIVQLHRIFALDILQNVFFELACAQCLNTAFLTERELHIESLNYLSQDSISSERNLLIQKHLTSLVPFVSSARVEDLLKLREKESDSFIIFRQALTKAVEEYRSNLDRPFGPSDARQLFGDVIEPGLSKLDQTIKSATRKLLKGTAARVIAWAGAISFGCYTGFVPSDLIQAATALGLTQVLVELGAPLLSSRFRKEDMASKDMYFLWQVRELSNKG